MALVNCRECNGQVSDSAAACPHCGAKVPKKPSNTWKWVIGVPAGLFVAMMVIGSMNSDPEKTKARQVYELCLSDLASADRARNGTSNFIAGTCERLKSEFHAKYGTNP